MQKVTLLCSGRVASVEGSDTNKLGTEFDRRGKRFKKRGGQGGGTSLIKRSHVKGEIVEKRKKNSSGFISIAAVMTSNGRSWYCMNTRATEISV